MLDIEILQREYTSKLRALTGLGSSQPTARRRGVEQEYGQAYQRLVSAGVKPQLRTRYRG